LLPCRWARSGARIMSSSRCSETQPDFEAPLTNQVLLAATRVCTRC
jgi:hypothetical protein